MAHELTVKEFAAVERVDERTVRRWIEKGAVHVRRTPGGGVLGVLVSEPNIIVADRRGYGWTWFSGVYFLRCGEFIKIGYAQDVRLRLEAIRSSNPQEVRPIGFVECDSLATARRIEREWHERCASWRVRGEWFKCDDEILMKVQSATGLWPTPKRKS